MTEAQGRGQSCRGRHYSLGRAMDRTARHTIAQRLFTDHPRSLGMSWAGHGIGAARIGFALIGAGLAAIVHAVVPGLFTDTAGRTIDRIHDHIHKREAVSTDAADSGRAST